MRFRKREESDFQAEIEAHIRLEADRLIADGMSPAEAQAAAQRAFGNVTQAQERFYEAQRWQWFDQLLQDLRYGLRSLFKTPAFTATAALTIALGVGANTAVFSLFDAVLLRSLPVRGPKQLVFLEAAGTAGTSGPPPYPCFERLRAETRSFSAMATFASDEFRVEIDGQPEQVMAQVASGNYFDVLGLKPELGRLMNPDDEKLSPPVAVISDRYWRRRFGADPAAIGKTVSVRDQVFTIVGVTPPEFYGMRPGSPVDVTLPITFERRNLTDAGNWWLQAIVARLKPDASPGRAEAESNAVFQSFLPESHLPQDLRRKHFQRLEALPAAHGMDLLRRRFSKPLYALMGIAGLVLLMATANIANLLLARGIARQREFAIRLATGAARLRLLRQLLTETLLLFGLGAIPGVIAARSGVGIIQNLFAEGRRAITLDVDLNWRVLAFTMMVTLAAALLAGLFPAWRAFRIDPEQAMREGSRAGDSRASAAITRTLVVFQVALSLVLLVGAVTFVKTLINLRKLDPGFPNDQVLTMSIQVPDEYRQEGKTGAIWARTLEAVRTIPGVRSAGLATFTPLSGRDRGWGVKIRGYQPATSEDGTIHINQVSEGYFETLGVRLLRGRLLGARDTEGMPPVVLINETAARKYFGNRDPIGQTLDFGRRDAVNLIYEIAGIVQDTKHMNLREPTPAFAFVPLRQAKDAERRVTLAVSSSAPNGQMALIQPIRSKLAEIDPALFLSDIFTIRTQLDSTLLTERLLSGLSSAFGVLALLLAAVGLYGVLGYRIGQQRRSIAIRVALGASPASVGMGVIAQCSLLLAVGVMAGLPFALLAARAADSMSWGVTSSDPLLYAMGVALLGAAGLGSAWLPARRASAIDPAEALRHD